MRIVTQPYINKNLANMSMGGTDNRISVLDSIVLSSIMIYVWTHSAMWSNSLWVNETDTMSYAEHGISGFGFGYGGFVFTLHLLLENFGEADHIFRGFSLISSLLNMILLYSLSTRIFGRGGGIVASIAFIWSGYSIEFGMQVREYAVHTMVLTGLLYWILILTEEVEGREVGGRIGVSPLLASFGVWFVSDHWFCQFFLLMLFISFIISFLLEDGSRRLLSRVPRKSFPPIITLFCTLILESLSILKAVFSASQGEHHLGGGSVSLVVLDPLDFLHKISSGSGVIVALFVISLLIQAYSIKWKQMEKRDLLLGGILICSVLMWLSLSVAQYSLHGLIVERYFYFWFPTVCLFCGLASMRVHDWVVDFSGNRSYGLASYLAVIFLIVFTSNIEPDTSPYGDMKAGFEKIDVEVENQNFSIVSRPPEHILRYYVKQFELNPDLVVGAWHEEELNLSEVRTIDSEVVAVISLQSSWILEASGDVLEESGYQRDEGATFSNSGDTIWIWRRVL